MRRFVQFFSILIVGLSVFGLSACNKAPQEQTKQEEKTEEVQQADATFAIREDEAKVSVPSWKYNGDNLLCRAISANDLQEVKNLIKGGMDVNNPQACVVLHENETESCDFSALSLAVSEGNLSIVKELITAGADLNKKIYCVTWYGGEGEDEYYPVPLYIAIKGIPFNEKEINKDVVKELITAGADVNAKDEDNNTLLELVNDPEIAQMLLQHGATDSLVAAMNRGDWTAFDNLLKTAGPFDKNSALIRAVTLNNIPLTQKLIKAGADVSATIDNDRHAYSNGGCVTITPLSVALDKKFTEMATLLKEKGANEKLCTAIWSGDLQRVQQAVLAGADVNEKYESCFYFDCFNSSPLQAASWLKNTEITELLKQYGAKE